jgi:hypothetical protein
VLLSHYGLRGIGVKLNRPPQAIILPTNGLFKNEIRNDFNDVKGFVAHPEVILFLLAYF